MCKSTSASRRLFAHSKGASPIHSECTSNNNRNDTWAVPPVMRVLRGVTSYATAYTHVQRGLKPWNSNPVNMPLSGLINICPTPLDLVGFGTVRKTVGGQAFTVPEGFLPRFLAGVPYVLDTNKLTERIFDSPS